MAAISSSAEAAAAGRGEPSADPSEAPRTAAAPRSPSTPRASNPNGSHGRGSPKPCAKSQGDKERYHRTAVMHAAYARWSPIRGASSTPRGPGFAPAVWKLGWGNIVGEI